jgi:SAM-dependent methyltransferase
MPSVALRGQVGPADAFEDIALYTMGRMNMAGLRPEHDVLDIGCGVGRTARFLCDFLSESSYYEGFDIKENGIQWCHENITAAYPNFNFQHVALSNTAYSPGKGSPASEFEFPYADNSFDFAFAHSVFTHLLPDSTVQYLRECGRVLRPGGTLYSTWFLFGGADTHPHISKMTPLDGNSVVLDQARPEVAIGYREQFVRDSHAAGGLEITDPVHSGFIAAQDAVVATKPAAPAVAT